MIHSFKIVRFTALAAALLLLIPGCGDDPVGPDEDGWSPACIDYGSTMQWRDGFGISGRWLTAKVYGDFVFTGGSEYPVRIFDISKPGDPRIVGDIALSGDARGIDIRGDLAYILIQSHLLIVDISELSTPSIVGFVSIPSTPIPSYLGNVIVSGDYAFVVDGVGGFHSVDISSASSPAITGYIETPGEAMDLDLAGIYAYVADGESGLRAINISDPEAPRILGGTGMPGTCYGFSVSGVYACAACGEAGAVAVDLSSPSLPRVLGRVDTPGYSRDVLVVDTYAMVADFHGGLLVVDLMSPRSPVIAGSVTGIGYPVDISADGEIVCTAGDGGAINLFDISKGLVPPAYIGRTGTRGLSLDVEVSGDFAYVADMNYGLKVLDISSPDSPLEVARSVGSSDAMAVDISGDYAYVAFVGDLKVVDISDPHSPDVVGSANLQGPVQDVAVQGDYAYLVNIWGFHVIDISEPDSPFVTGSYITPGMAVSVDVSGHYAYVADKNSGFTVIDISMPDSPEPAGLNPVLTTANSVAVHGDYAYVTDDTALHIVNITVRGLYPVEGSLETPGEAVHVTLSGDYAYVSDSGFGVQVVDISEPTSPVLTGGINLYALGTAHAGDFVCVAGSVDGLWTIPRQCGDEGD